MADCLDEVGTPTLPNLRHLRAFSLTARLKSVKRAAAEIYLSQPAVTQAIANLEALYGHVFFDRTSGGMFLTEIGEIFLRRVDRALADLSRACLPPETNGSRDGLPDASRLLTASHIRVVIALSDHAGLDQAARALGTSRASIQRTTRNIEAALGGKLFIRSSTGIRLSETGAQLSRGAKLAARELELAQEEIEQFLGQKVGRMVVGSLPLSLIEVVPLALMKLLDEIPDLSVRVIEGPYGNQLDGLRNGDIDMMVGALRTPAPTEDVVQRPLFDDPLSVVVRVGHPLTRLKSVTLSDTVGYAWVLPRRGTPTRSLFHRAFRRRALAEPKRLLEISSHASVRSILLGSDRVGLISRRQIRFEEEAGLITVLPIDLPEATRPIGLTMRADWVPSQAQKMFIRELESLAGAYAGDEKATGDQPGINRIRMGTFPAPG